MHIKRAFQNIILRGREPIAASKKTITSSSQHERIFESTYQVLLFLSWLVIQLLPILCRFSPCPCHCKTLRTTACRGLSPGPLSPPSSAPPPGSSSPTATCEPWPGSSGHSCWTRVNNRSTDNTKNSTWTYWCCCHRTPARGPRGHLRAELPRVRAGVAGQPGGGRHAGAHEPDARCARGGEAVLNTLLYTVLCTVQVARLLDIAQPRLVITDDGLLPVLAEAATMTATKVTLYTATCSFQDGDPPLDCRLTL